MTLYKYKKILIVLASCMLLWGTSCKKMLDVNKNLNDPTAVPVSTLLTAAELNLGNNLAMSSGLSSGLAVYMHQACTRGASDGYGIRGDNGIVTGAWSGLYRVITNLNVVINQGTAEKRYVYVGIAKILKAYTFSVMVDVWGDIPFSEFDQFKNDVKQPKFDDDATIYPQLFAMIDAGIADINNVTPNPSVPTTDDLIYGGNKTRWIKAANTIKLKLYTQVRLVQNVTPQVTALLANNGAMLISANNESFLLPYGPLGTSDDRNPGYSDYTASQRGQNVSPWLYEIMKGYNPNIYTGIRDPRVPYYWYNQKKYTDAADNNTEYRDTGFITLYFGSLGGNRNGAQQLSYSLFGIYPVGGRYDEGLGIPISTAAGHVAPNSAGTGAAPYRFLTYADRLYLEAELINTNVIAGDARAVFNNALTASMTQVDYVITTYVKPSQSVPVLATQPATTAYIANVLAAYDASANNARKLEHIMTQKWLSRIGCNVDQYTDYRRTGFPILFDPRNTTMAPGGFAQPPINGNFFVNPQTPVSVALSKNFAESLPWSQTEIELNSNAPTQKVPENYKIFWKP
jgi:hypothetical protein